MTRYLTELKIRLIFIYIAVLTTFIVSYIYKKKLLLSIAMTYKHITPYFIYTDVYEIFYTSFFICEWLSNQIFYLYLLYHATLFILPILNVKKYLIINKIVFYIVQINLIAFLLTYNIVFPKTLTFFYNFQSSTNFMNSINLFLEAKILELIHFFFQIHLSLIVCVSLLCFVLYIGSSYCKYNGYLRKYFYISMLLAVIAILSLNLTISFKFLILILFTFELICFKTTVSHSFEINKEAS